MALGQNLRVGTHHRGGFKHIAVACKLSHIQLPQFFCGLLSEHPASYQVHMLKPSLAVYPKYTQHSRDVADRRRCVGDQHF